MRLTFLFCLLVIQPLVALSKLDHRALETLGKKVGKLDKSCSAATDCFGTGRESDFCPTMCNGCGWVINNKEKGAFDAIVTKALTINPESHCPMAKCAPSKCDIKCDNKVCSGTNE